MADAAVPVATKRTSSPWWFLLTAIPYGVVGSFTASVMPFRMTAVGRDLENIGWFTGLLMLPTVFQFLYAPIVDVRFLRKTWLLVVATLGAVCLCIACLIPLSKESTDGTVPFLIFAFLAQAISGLVGTCNGALMSTSIPDAKRGQASAALNIGNLSGGALSAFVAIKMIDWGLPPIAIGLALSVLMIGPAIAVLAIAEPPREMLTANEQFSRTLKDIVGVVASKKGLTGIALCISPVGTAALANFFAGMAKPFGAGAGDVAILQGPLNAGLTAIGALAGGFLCDRFNRRAMYLTSGGLTAVVGLLMAISPQTLETYWIYVCIYALVTGFCYAAFTAAVLETIGDGGATAGTQYAIFVAAGNAAINWVGIVDTRFSTTYGVQGVIFSDAALNILGVVILGVVFAALGMFKSTTRKAEPAAAA